MSKADKTKQFIVERTAPIFNKRGYAGTSLSDLIAATGLTKGAIYGNFLDKDEVAVAAFDYNVAAVTQFIQQQVKENLCARDKLLAYIGAYRLFYDRMVVNGGCPYMNAAVDADDTHPVLYAKVKVRLHDWYVALMDILEEGIRTGEFGEHTDKRSFAALFIAIVEGSILLSKTLGYNEYLLRNLDFLEKQVDVLLIQDT